MKGRGRLFAALFAVATAMVALGFSFFQGFELNTNNWIDFGGATVVRVSSPSTSTSYNSGTTSVYADGLNAASGSFFSRVKSAVSTDQCFIDTLGPGADSSLLCEGPFTDFGLVPSGNVAAPFPSGGYTTKVDLYLDVNYANHHPDCGTASPVGAPCTPDTPGTVNPACVTDPNGIDCEGSRFTWTVGLNDPTGAHHRDYVFQVGTLPDPHTGGFGGCTSGGYVINAQYNSFRSGGQPYSGFDPKCIATSGWYTFKQVFSNVGGNLNVEWDILNSDGTAASCQDTNGASVDCTWSRTLGSSDDPITSIGCPRYGWLANEEINDLAVDNIKLDTVGGDCGQVQVTAQITPTNTTCQQFASGAAATLSQLQYNLKGGNINAVSPGVFFYYTQVTTGTSGQTVEISQVPPTPPGAIPIQQSQAILYSSSCTKLGSLSLGAGGTASTTLPSAGTFIIGVKYTPSSLKGDPPPNPAIGTYTFDTSIDGTEEVTKQITLAPK